MRENISGAVALAQGAIEAGVSFVSGYPGAPATAVFNALLEMTHPDVVRLEWTSNEKTALELAYGASLGGMRSMLCVKGVGLNIALDPLMSMNLAGCNAGLVILVGDDPGGWGSQNEQDSRALALATELPTLEPITVADAQIAMLQAFQLSERVGLPVIVRITRALALSKGESHSLGPAKERWSVKPLEFKREYMKWVVLPINVVEYHQRLHEKIGAIQATFEASNLNKLQGTGPYGVIAAGFTYQRLLDLLSGQIPPELRILGIGTLYPLPISQLAAFLQGVNYVLVLEETLPLIERAIKGIAQEIGLTLPIFGRETDHIPWSGELFSPQMAAALVRILPSLDLEVKGETSRYRPSREPLCEGCPYIPTFEALDDVINQFGGREEFIITGDPGCMVRAQRAPFYLMDVKNSLGSGIGMGAGLALSFTKEGKQKQIVALCGDSGFLHSGFSGLVDAVGLGVRLLVVILDNGTTALSGFQPHPASGLDIRGSARPRVGIAALAREAGASTVQVVNLDQGEDIRFAIENGMNSEGVAVIIARGKCAMI
jgi:indolepyruvate ferredoxin oxidoreductase alpha subunit